METIVECGRFVEMTFNIYPGYDREVRGGVVLALLDHAVTFVSDFQGSPLV